MLEVMEEHIVTTALVGGVSLLSPLIPFSTERRLCFYPLFSSAGKTGPIFQLGRLGTAKMTLSKDFHFPPLPFCKTSAPVHPGQPRLLLSCVRPPTAGKLLKVKGQEVGHLPLLH